MRSHVVGAACFFDFSLAFFLDFSLAFFLILAGGAHAQCYSGSPANLRLYSSKTSYAEALRSLPKSPENKKLQGCTPRFVYLVGRHGFRFPSTSRIEEFAKRLPAIQNLIRSNNRVLFCKEDETAILGWKQRMLHSEAKSLAETGWDEWEGIGSRFKEHFPDLFPRFSGAQFNFRSTDSNRTIDSARAFTNGAFGDLAWKNFSIKIETEDEENDELLKFYDSCPKWEKEIDGAELPEVVKFRSGRRMRTVKETVARRLGIEQAVLAFDDVDLMYDACRFEWGLYGDAPWCAAFTKQELDILNYANDLKYFWKEGYGFAINSGMSCNLLADIYRLLKQQEAGSSSLKGAFRFAHSGTINSLLGLLGLYRDSSPLRASDFQNEHLWRSSQLIPKSANVAFVLHQCGGDDGHKFKLQTLHQERDVELPSCDWDGCHLSKVLDAWKPIVDDCDLSKMCQPSAIAPPRGGGSTDARGGGSPGSGDGGRDNSAAPLSSKQSSRHPLAFCLAILTINLIADR